LNPAKAAVPFDLAKSCLTVDHDGSVAVLPASGGPPPRLEGLTIGAPRMSRIPPHGGERHPDGDEILYLLSGRIDVILEEPEGERTVAVAPGEAFVVPRGVWHRIDLREPSQLLFITPGPRAEHRPLVGPQQRD
jgi:quercetin dioxygenase-like cupin family protein